jgi:hypothetical protein
MRRIALLTLLMVASVLATSAQVSYKFTTLDVPDSIFTRAHGINIRGDIVGLFSKNGGHGFLLHKGTYSTIDFPGATFTGARGINSSRTITGGYVDSNGVTQLLASCLPNLEVEDVGNLEGRPIKQNQVATDHDVRIIGGGGGGSMLSRSGGQSCTFSGAPAAEFHEPLLIAA